MNELQLGLIGAGAVVVVGVVAYNKWQERKHRQVAEAMLRRDHEDVLLVPREGTADAGGEGFSSGAEETASTSGGQRFNPEFAASFADAPESKDSAEFTDTQTGFQEPRLREEDPGFTGERIEPVLGDPSVRRASGQEPSSGEAGALPVYTPPQRPDTPRRADSPGLAPERAKVPVADEGTWDSTATDALGEPPVPPPLPRVWLADLADDLVALETIESLPGARFVLAQAEALARLPHRVSWVGYDERAREWVLLDRGTQTEFRRVRVGLQLVDRRGPVSENELTLFHTAMQQVADEFLAIVDLPPRRAVHDRALELDRFCAQVDIQVGVNVVAGQASFPGTKLRALAEASGLVLETGGAFVRRDEDGRELYRLITMDGAPFALDTLKSLVVHGLTFLIDVPRVANGDRVFFQVIELARRFADALHGQVVDDNRQPLTDNMVALIRGRIQRDQQEMASRGMPAGEALALRLFN